MFEPITYILCLGSNTSDKAELIVKAQQRLGEFCLVVSESGVYEAPDESGLGEPYVNVVMEARSELAPELLKERLKALEREFGRTAESKLSGQMPLDADIIICAGEIVDRYQYSREYFKKGYGIISK